MYRSAWLQMPCPQPFRLSPTPKAQTAWTLASARTREHAFIRTQQTVRDIPTNQSTEKTRLNTAANTANTANTGANRVHTNTRAGEHNTNTGFALGCCHFGSDPRHTARAIRSAATFNVERFCGNLGKIHSRLNDFAPCTGEIVQG